MARRLLGLAALVVLGELACRAPPARGVRPVRLGLHAAPSSLDPHLQNEVAAFTILSNVCETLVQFDAEMRPQPLLAESWENPDELTWRFHLQRGVRFHDGRPLTAADVAASLERARSLPGTRASSYLVALDAIRVLDAGSVELVTRHPYPVLLNKLAFVFVVPADAPASIERAVGTGPYRLVAGAPGEVALEAFADYWGEAPELEQIRFSFVPERSERLERLLSGELDVATRLAAEDLPRVRASDGVRVASRGSLMVVFLLLRLDAPPLDDVRVRRAVHLALDREALVREALRGEGAPATQMVSRAVFGAIPVAATEPSGPEAARALLAAAGHPEGVRLALESRDGVELAPLLRQLARAGIEVEHRASPWSALYPRLLAGEVAFFHGGWIAAPGDASDVLDSMAHSPDPQRGYGDANWSGLADPELDRMIEEAGTLPRADLRRERLQRALAALGETHTLVPLYVPNDLYGVSAELEWEPRLDARLLAREMRRR